MRKQQSHWLVLIYYCPCFDFSKSIRANAHNLINIHESSSSLIPTAFYIVLISRIHGIIILPVLKSLHTESEIFVCVFSFFSYSSSFPIKCFAEVKTQKIKPGPIYFLWQTKVSEAVCKRDWHNVRSYLFFNVRRFRIQCAMSFIVSFFPFFTETQNDQKSTTT